MGASQSRLLDSLMDRYMQPERAEVEIRVIIPPGLPSRIMRTEDCVVRIDSSDEFPWRPNLGAQAGFFSDLTSRWCGCAGGFRSGKSVAAARKLLLLHLMNAFDYDGRPTFVRGLLCALSYSLAKSTNLPQLQSAARDFGLSVRVHSDPMNMRCVFPDLGSTETPSEILVRSAEVPRAIAAFEVGHIWGDEVARWYRNADRPEEDALLQCDGRLSDARARCIQFNATSTHEGDDTTFYNLFGAQYPDRKLYTIPTIENAHRLEPNYIESKRSLLTKELFDQYIMGIPTSTRGAPMYYAFSDANISAQPLPIDQRLILCATLDFNVNPGSYCEVFLCDQETRRIFVLQEIFARSGGARQVSEKLSAWINEELVAKLPKVNPTPWPFPGLLNLFGDASGGNRNLADARLTAWSEVTETLRLANIPCTMEHVPDANPRVGDRVSALNCGLRSMSGEVKIIIHGPACPGLLEDLRRMRWDKGKEDKSDQERSHPSSAIGYACAQLIPIR